MGIALSVGPGFTTIRIIEVVELEWTVPARGVSEVGRLSLEKTRKFGKRLYVFKNLNVFLMLRDSSRSI